MPSHKPAHRKPTLTVRFLSAEQEVSRNTELMEALVAAGAIIAHADGEAAATERRRILSIARKDPRLAGFSYEQLAEEFSFHEANYLMDPELANEMAIEKIEQVRSRRRAARMIVDACRQIIPADGVAHPAEFRALSKVKRILAMEPEVS